jgi:NADP-dependent aldehyde dehydrogenase
MIYRTDHADGAYLVSHPQVGASGYTGSRRAGMVLKAAADAVGKPIYLEMSSINPVFVLPGALAQRGAAIAEELAGSALLGAGQFCTNPGIIVLQASADAEAFIADVRERFAAAEPGPLLGAGGVSGLAHAVRELGAAGAQLLVGGAEVNRGCRFQNTLLRASGEAFLADPARLQTEAFGNANLFVVADDAAQLERIADAFEGNLTGTLYSHTGDEDEDLYARIAPRLRRKVGRLLNDKMPTGVAVVAAMNHGGPFPATGHPGFTAVGIPASIRRFAMLECYDAVREHRLPPELRDANPTGVLWRLIDGTWTQADVGT